MREMMRQMLAQFCHILPPDMRGRARLGRVWMIWMRGQPGRQRGAWIVQTRDGVQLTRGGVLALRMPRRPGKGDDDGERAENEHEAEGEELAVVHDE